MWGRPGRKVFLPYGPREKRGRKLAAPPQGSAVFGKLDGRPPSALIQLLHLGANCPLIFS